jgi:1-acyl-sn-glycerol-3-phosphate acyltransferase
MVKSTIFDNSVLGQITRRTKQIPVNRGTSDAAKSLDAARAALDAGEAVVIYPEGTLTKDPAQWPMQAKSGLARLVLLAPDVPVIPIGQWGSQQVKNQGSWHLLRRRTAAASVGHPVSLTRGGPSRSNNGAPTATPVDRCRLLLGGADQR